MATKIAFDGQMLDITEPEAAEVLVRQDGGVLWVNVDGFCVLRICRLRKGVLQIKDARTVKVIMDELGMEAIGED